MLPHLLRIAQLLAIMGLILCIVGATDAPSPQDIYSESTIHVGIILFAVVTANLLLFAIAACITQTRNRDSETRLVLAVLCALPFIAVRVAFALLVLYAHDKTFKAVGGSKTAELLMSVLPEIVVTIMYLITGVTLLAVAKSSAPAPQKSLGYRFGGPDIERGLLFRRW